MADGTEIVRTTGESCDEKWMPCHIVLPGDETVHLGEYQKNQNPPYVTKYIRIGSVAYFLDFYIYSEGNAKGMDGDVLIESSTDCIPQFTLIRVKNIEDDDS
jgi:hypothetical protein